MDTTRTTYHQIDKTQSDFDRIRRQMIELSIRSNYYVSDVYHMVYGTLYPPLRKSLEGMGLSPIYKDRVCESPIVAVNDGRVIGFCIYTVNMGLIHIERLLVEKSYRYKGIGTDLINMLKEKLEPPIKEKPDLIPPITVVSTLKARPFYEKQGFIQIKATDDGVKMMYMDQGNRAQLMMIMALLGSVQIA